MAEQTFYENNGVTVTNARFIVPGQTYAMSGVTSVKSLRHDPSKKGPIILIILGLLGFAAGKDAMFVAFLMLAAGIAWLVLNKPKFSVVLNSSSGEAEAMTSKDQGIIQQIVSALNESIIARG